MKRAGGEKVISANYIGDIGAHVAKCLWCLKEFHSGEKLPENKASYIGKIYVEAAERIEKDESLKDAVQEVQRLLESGDKEWNALWKETRQWSLDEFNSIYDKLGVKFDVFYYESQVEKEGKKIVEKLLSDGIAEMSEGAVIVDLKEYGLDIFLALKRDGTSLYSTKDLALAKKKFKDYDLDESVYIVDGRQSTYFKQLFKVLEIMGFKKKLVHVPYEFVSTPQGVIASRAGNVILFEDYYESARQNLIKETKERHPEWTSKKLEENASVLALAALKFWMLKHDTGSEIMFTAESALSLEGETGTYLLYVIARINSITRQVKFTKGDPSLLKEPEEKKLVRLLWAYPQAVEQATRQLKPHIIARHMLEIAQSFNTFYHQHQVLKAEPELRNARLALIDAVRQTIENGLKLLGIETVEEM
jgi:arginyl-tRNA synthetase